MGLRINTTNPALEAQRQIGQRAQALSRNFEGLSSALRINRARDDAAGLAIAERLRADIRQLGRETSNIQSGIGLVQTAEGGLDAQQGVVSRLQELALQAANGALNDDQRAAINAEAQQLVGELDQTAENTEFNGVAPLQGVGPIELGVGGGLEVEVQESTAASLGLSGLDLSTQAGAQAALGNIGAASDAIAENRANLGAQQNTFESAIAVRENTAVNLQAAESNIRDLDIAQAAIERTRNQVLLQSATASLIQGNIVPQTAARLLGG
jgi:flagellin